MAIHQVASGNSNSIMSFLFQDDGAVEGTVLEGAEFAKTLHQLLGEYEAQDATVSGTGVSVEDFMAMSATDAAAPTATETTTLADTTPLTAELDTLATDFTLPATSAALPDASNWEGAAEGEEVEQPFWGIAPFTDVTATLQQHATSPASNHGEIQADTILGQATAAAPVVTDAPIVDTAAVPGAVPADMQPGAKPVTPTAPVFTSGIQHVIDLARDAAQASAQLTTPSPLPTPIARHTTPDTGTNAGTGRNAPASGKFLPLTFRPAANTLNQAMAGLQARNAQTTTTETLSMPVSDTLFTLPEIPGAEARSQQAAAPQTPTQGIHALRTDNALPNLARTMAANESAATANTLQFESQHLAGTDAWLQDLGTRVDWMKDLKVDKAELQLHPAELGLLEIQISAGDDGTTVSFVTHNAAARELIEDSMPRLRELLANQGMQLGQSQVSQQSEGQRREQDLNQGHAAAQNATADEPAPARRSAYMADPNRIDHYV
jgi:flagellar hook-length control protein FliK